MVEKIDGPLLLQIDESFGRNVLGIDNSLRLKRLLRKINKLKDHQLKFRNVHIYLIGFGCI